MRSRAYGTQPVPPSDMAIVMFGNLRVIGVHIRSLSARNEFIGVMAMLTSTGASIDVTVIDDDEPMCMHTTVPASSQAARNGSQWSEWRPGRPSFSGFSEKVTA